MKNMLLKMVLAGCCFHTGTFGQVYIRGRITDGLTGLPFASVMLLKSDSLLVKTVVTDEKGAFAFEQVAPANYLISVSMLGYRRFISKEFNLTGHVTLPDIVLQTALHEMEEAVVKGQRPFLEQQSDRIVMHLKNSILSSGNTVLELLQKSPGVIVDRQSGRLGMNGKTGIQLMMNGKIVQMPTDMITQLLDGMNAANVEKIELIHTPSAKYDAEGNAGIIHIVTKTETDYGITGAAGVTLGKRWAETLGGNFNLTWRAKNFAWMMDYSILRNHNLHVMEIDRKSTGNEFQRLISVYNHRENVTTQQNLNTALEWQISMKTALNLGFSGYRRNWQMTAASHDNDRVSADSAVVTDMQVRQSNIWQSLSGTVGINSKINAKNEIGISFDYLYYQNENPSSYDSKLFFEKNKTTEAGKTDLVKNTPIRFLVGKADYTYTFSTAFRLETGVKGFVSDLDNDVVVRRFVNAEWVRDSAFSSRSFLKEQVAAAYVSGKWQGTRGWQVSGGLRYEYTHTSISEANRKSSIDRKYGYFFPGLLVKKEIGNGRDVQFSYNKRITRPTYNDIASYAVFWSPNTFIAGNTALLPALADAIRLGCHFQKWDVALQYTHIRNELVTLQPEIDPRTNVLTYQSQNLRFSKILALSGSYGFKPAAWWEVQSTVTLQRHEIQTDHLAANVRLDLFGLNAGLLNVYSLPKAFSIEVSGTFQSRSLSGISEYLPSGSLNAGVQKRLGKHGTVKLAMDDILYTNKWRVRTFRPENHLDLRFRYNWHNQFLRLTYSRSLGNNKLRALKLKSGSEEERGRIGN